MDLFAGLAAFPDAAFGAEFSGDGLEGRVFDVCGWGVAEAGFGRCFAVLFPRDEGPVGGVGHCVGDGVVCVVLLCVSCTVSVGERSRWFTISGFWKWREKIGLDASKAPSRPEMLLPFVVDARGALPTGDVYLNLWL